MRVALPWAAPECLPKGENEKRPSIQVAMDFNLFLLLPEEIKEWNSTESECSSIHRRNKLCAFYHGGSSKHFWAWPAFRVRRKYFPENSRTHFFELEETTARSAHNQSRIPKSRKTSAEACQTQILKRLELSEEKERERERPQEAQAKMGLQTFDKTEKFETGSVKEEEIKY